MEKDIRRHRRMNSEPWKSSNNAVSSSSSSSSSSAGSLGDLNVDVRICYPSMSTSSTSSLSKEFEIPHFPKEINSPILSGTKHMRSSDCADDLSPKPSHLKAPATSTFRKSRSLPPIEFQILHPQLQPKHQIDNISRAAQQINVDANLSRANATPPISEHTQAPLSSISMDAFETIFKVNSEDWNEAWNQREEDTKSNLISPKLQELSLHSSSQSSGQSSLRKKLIPNYVPISPQPKKGPLQSIQEGTNFPLSSPEIERNRNNKTPDLMLTPLSSISSPPSLNSPSYHSNFFSSRPSSGNGIWPEVILTPDFKETKIIGQDRKNNSTGMISKGDMAHLAAAAAAAAEAVAERDSRWAETRLQSLHPNTNHGIAEIEFHPAKSSGFDVNNQDYYYINDKKVSRGRYRCGRCGQLKANHDCPFASAIATRSISTQSERMIYPPHIHPFLREQTITVGRSWSSISSSSYSFSSSSFSSRNLSNLPSTTDTHPVHVSSHQILSQNEYSSSQVPTSTTTTTSTTTSTTTAPSASPNPLEMDKFKDIRIIHPSLRNHHSHSHHNSSPNLVADTPPLVIRSSYSR